MTDFEPSDQLTVEIEAQATQSYQIRVTQVPSIIKLVIAVVNEDVYPIIAKVFKQGNQLPVKEYKGQTEILDVIEVFEEMDAGTYSVELTNPVYKMQDATFIFKQIRSNQTASSEEQLFESKKDVIEIDTSAISEDELRMYRTLDQAYKNINQFQVEQGLQQLRINKFLRSQEKAKKSTFKVAIGEGVVIVVIAIFNVFYIQRVLDNKRVI